MECVSYQLFDKSKLSCFAVSLMYTLITSSKYFFLDFAEELQNQKKLDKLVIGYPRFKLRNYAISKKRVSTFPYLHASLMKFQSLIGRLPLPFQNFLSLLDVKSITIFAKLTNRQRTTFVAMSSMALEILSSSRIPERQKVVIFRASRHIVEQNDILQSASRKWGIHIQAPSLSMIRREISEYELADLIIVPSKICADSFVRQGIDQDKVKIIYFPYTLNTYANDSETVRDRKKVTFIGNVSAQKGIVTLLEAWRMLEKTDLILTIIGKTDYKFNAYLEGRGLVTPNVHFTNHLNHNEIQYHLAQTSLFIMPSIQEGWPMALMEAISMQCVTLVSDAICKIEELPNPEMNFIFESGNHAQLAQMISKLTSEDLQTSFNEERSRLGAYPVRTWTNFVDEFSEIVEALYRNDQK